MKARVLSVALFFLVIFLNQGCKPQLEYIGIQDACAYVDCPLEGGHAAATALLIGSSSEKKPAPPPPPPPTPLDSLPVVDTGLTVCYDDTASKACSDGTYQWQDGEHSDIPNARSFTGPTQHVTYTSDYTTYDNVTLLTWTSCSLGLSTADCSVGTANKLTRALATNDCIDLDLANVGAGYAGLKNWRLPTISELQTIIDYGVTNPAIDSALFPNIDTTDSYWASTEYKAYAPGVFGWFVDFSNGVVSFGDASNLMQKNVLCVTSGP